MIEFKFILNPGSDNLEIEDPQGFESIELSIIRDEKTHGIGYEASTSSLGFYGMAYDFLKTEKETNGLKADVIFQALSRCDEEAEWEEILRGRLNFGRYKETCGAGCMIFMPIEQDGCIFTFKNRYDQKVDIDSSKGFDGFTQLPEYGGLNMEMELPAKALLAINEAKTDVALSEVISDQSEWFMTQGPDALLGHIAPGFQNVTNSSLGAFNASSFPELINGGANNRPPYLEFTATTNTAVLLGDIKCSIANTVLSFRLKGSAVQVTSGSNLTTLRTKVFRLPVGLDPAVLGNWVAEYSADLVILTNTETEAFDQSAEIPLTIAQGDQIYFSVFILVSDFSRITSLTWNQTTESFLKIEASTLCENSFSEVNLIHETLSRVAESTTNYCLRAKSSYYGRTDSEPFSFSEDGCGSLRMLTSGLKIRRAEEDKFFASVKDLIEGLNGIDNIGFDIIDDPDRTGKFLFRVEAVDFFYKDEEILRMSAIPDSSLDIEEARFYAKILVGYKKWEVEKINGLDEFNSNREYRTSLSSVSNPIDLTSALVAGSYAIEITRQQSFAESGGADTKYDNEIFIICVKRNPYDYDVEQGNIANAENIYSPSTIYNFRISPLRNLMRWYKSLVTSYPNYSDADNKLYFSAGTGNLIAKGELDIPAYTDSCVLESMPISENQNLFTTHFAGDDFIPIWKNESIPFEYDLSIADYKKIKANPYGYISYQCGTGDWEKGFIKEIKFRPVKGMATITLRKKWQ